MNTVTELKAKEVTIICPVCGETQDGFIGDPRGGVFECDDCEEQYCIDSESDIEMY